MVEKISVSPLDVRGYGNVLSVKDTSELLLSDSFVELVEDTVDGSVRDVFRMFYNDPTLLFSFDRVEKCLYLNVDDGTLSFNGKRLVVDSNSYEFGFEDKVLFIDETVGPVHSYSLSFSESSYEAVGGSATLSLSLLDNSLPVDGAVVSVSGSDSSSYTATTNSNGIATVTVNVSADTTFTASYSNVSATCTVIVPVSPYIWYDDCSVDNTSQYTQFLEIWAATTTVHTTLSFSTDHYVLTNTNASFSAVVLPVSTGLNNYRLSAKIRLLTNSSNKGGGVGVATQKDKGTGLYQPNGTQRHLLLNNYREAIESQVTVSNLSTSNYNTFELTKQGNTLVWTIKDANGTQRFTKTVTITDTSYYPNCKPCICIGQSDSIYIKEIKLEQL